MEQEFKNGALQQTRVNFLGARGIEAVVAIEHTRGNQATLRWLLYDGHGNLVRTMAPDYALSAWQFRGVWGEVQGNLALGRGYCANLGHPEDETGLVYMRARYYEPATGRFISEDPARDGVNWYLYADGNPVGKVDVSGKHPVLAALLVGFLLGSVFGFFESLVSQLILNQRVDPIELLTDTLIGGILGGIGGAGFMALKGVKWASRLGIIRAAFEFMATHSSAKQIGVALLGAVLGGTLAGGIKAAVISVVSYVYGRQVQVMLYMASIDLEGE